MRAVCLTVLLCVAGLSVVAQRYPYTLKNYKAVDGLPQSQVRAMIEDRNGYLWLGTEGGGLARFDGQRFKVYTTLDGLQSNIITSLTFDAKGRLWILHPLGITRFDGREFRKFEQEGSRAARPRLRNVFVFQDTVFFMSAPGYLGKIHGDSVYYWSKHLFGGIDEQKAHNISFVRQASDGTLLFCINQKSFYCRTANGDFWISFDSRFTVVKSAFDYRGSLWLQTDTGTWSVDLKDRTVRREDFPITNPVVRYDSLGNVFWTHYGTRILRESIRNETVRTDTVINDQGITQILVDGEGNTWLGTNGHGLFKYFVQDFDRCGSDRLTWVMAILHDSDGATWVGTAADGLVRIRKGKVTHYRQPEISAENAIYSVAQSPNGDVYACGGAGLGRYNETTDQFEWQSFYAGERSIRAVDVEFVDERAMYLGLMGGGINYIEGDKVVNYSVRDGLNTNVVMAIHYSSLYETLFIGDEFGLSTLKDSKITNEKIDGFVNTSLIAIHPYRDSLLLLSTGGAGLIIYHPGSGERTFITTKDGLPSDFLYFAAPDEDGNLWLGSEKGITRIALDESLSIREQVHYNHQNGLTGVEANQNAFCFFEGNKLFGLVDGLYQFNDPPRRGRNAFDLHLTDVELSYGEVSPLAYSDTVAGFFHIPVNLVLPPDKNHITFQFNRVTKSTPLSTKYKYMLEGYDKTWSQPSSASYVTYGNLPPGQYVFLVMSNDDKGGWSELPLSYIFTVKAPFYLHPTFIVGAIVLLIMAIYLILYLRVQRRLKTIVTIERIRLQEQEHVRKEIARDFHDEMGNQLTRIINYVSLLKMNGKSGSGAGHEDLYTKVEESAKYLYTGTRDFIWSIDPANDELSKLFIHIRDFGDKLFGEKDMCFRATNSVRENVKLPYGFCREANLIFKEGMTNAFKYSGARNVTFSLSQREDGFEFCLEDDGVGYEPAEVYDVGRGLKNIGERAEKINATLKVNSVMGKGTKIVLHFKNSKSIRYGIAI